MSLQTPVWANDALIEAGVVSIESAASEHYTLSLPPVIPLVYIDIKLWDLARSDTDMLWGCTVQQFSLHLQIKIMLCEKKYVPTSPCANEES